VIRHRTDPLPPWRAAAVLGRLVAQGLLAEQEAAAALAAAPAPGADPLGWAARRAWRLKAAQDGWRRARLRALREARAALRPLLAARAPRDVLEDAVGRSDPHGALTRADRNALLHAEVARALAGFSRS
jgi:hypothetical protein